MEEQLLHFIWHRKLFNPSDLITTLGEQVEILHPGIPNQDQGPDFLQARIRIGDQLWAGHVEIHIRSSAWFLHMHDQDAHYNNVILHVVWEEDRAAATHDGFRVPCLELARRVELSLLERYRHLMNNEEWVPCASSLMTASELVRSSWLERLMAERLEHKTDGVIRMLARCGGDWEYTFYVMMLRQMGAPVNNDALEELGIKVPLTLLRRHGDRTDQIESLLFGTAGMLGVDSNSPYISRMKKEFDFLRKKYNLHPMQALQWKFMRMRPPHFPTIRIAQASTIIADNRHFISRIENLVRAEEWIALFSVRPADEFWNDHYHFTATTPATSKRLGRGTAMALIINVVAPIMFMYGKHQGKSELKERAIELLEELPPEKNAVIAGWQLCGWRAVSAGQSQAMLHLKKTYCDQRRCLHCAVGLQVLR